MFTQTNNTNTQNADQTTSRARLIWGGAPATGCSRLIWGGAPASRARLIWGG